VKTRLPILASKGYLEITAQMFGLQSGKLARIPMLWDTGATRTLVAWESLLGLGFTEDFLLTQKEVVLGHAVNGSVVEGMAVTIPMTQFCEYDTYKLFAEVRDMTVYTRRSKLSSVLGTDISSLFNYTWNNSEKYVEVEVRPDWQSEIALRDNSTDSYYSGFHLKTLMPNTQAGA
jgi:hypothetical protein